MDRNALAELLQVLEGRRDAEERRREERYTALIERTVKAPPELSKRVSTIRSTTTHHPTVSAPSTCTSALTQDW
ncbi:UNVERIFIED_CONTAM: hypothetical protein FKN15_056483 [Acipenser sinensis]